jgi:hypothetical protein
MLAAPKVTGRIARRHQGLAVFGSFSSYGTAGRQGTEVASDAELVAKTEFTSNLVPFVDKTEARKARHSPQSRRQLRPALSSRRSVQL